MAKQEEREENQQSWRKEVDNNINRLQSLLFGADFALENRDYSSAQLLSLRLLGFLDSRSQNDVDSSFIHPIRRDALSKLDASRRELTPVYDRQAFEAAGIPPGKIFSINADVDVKIKQSKCFRALIQQSSKVNTSGLGGQRDQFERMTRKTSKTTLEADLSSWHGNNMTGRSNVGVKGPVTSKNNGTDDCIILDKACASNNHVRGHSSFARAEEEERTLGNNLGVKRPHMETRYPRNDIGSPLSNKETNREVSGNVFVTARTKLEMEVKQKKGLGGSPSCSVSPISDYNSNSRGYSGKSYGVSRRGVRGNFIPPIRSNGNNAGNMTARIGGKCDDAAEDSTRKCLEMLCGPDGELPEKLRNLEPRLIEHVSNEIMDRDPNVRWDDIAGLEHAKKCVTEMVVWPLLRPDIFKGCRAPGRGLLLFGPPGTGKTMIGKAIAGEAKATFFYISASSLTSKWIGEGEKLVRALFGVASCRQPAVIFVDEIDSLLSQRKSEGEHEASRRLKTQFLIEMEGFDSISEQILLIGATNRPQELDEAARRRLTKRLYIPLPSAEARAWIVRNLLEKDGLFRLSKEDMDIICKLTEGYSGSDMKNLVKDASMGPLRDALRQGIEITKLDKEDMRPVTLQDFKDALQEVRPSVSPNELGIYENWNKQFGSLAV
ncbi:ATPase family AAA domain-containing protein FIGL1-like [Chenopodium quinoa]|uniref:ATPase family AAA domain-containing protein FIGL1-like n=1 Tax=Chenopodium quinoa TaxID=63459 RepID=UPI000B793F10|nr:ATPase family AAA domain-containing protein FIGL1-like [Chenopodium quinoa]